MTEWGLIAALGIPTVAFVAFMLGRTWEALGHEIHEPGPKSHPHSIRYLRERERRIRKCGR